MVEGQKVVEGTNSPTSVEGQTTKAPLTLMCMGVFFIR
jgi:hypothetical protein